jgi:hypothetical protein
MSAVDDVFDLAASADNTPEDSTNESAQVDTTDNTNDDDAASTGLTYPNVLRNLTADAVPEGQNPDGTLTVAEFASKLTVDNILAGKGIAGVVKDPAIYTGTKAKRHALPVVLVFPEGTTDFKDQSNVKVFLPVAEATEAYNTRPERGTGGAAGASKRSYDELLTDAAKKHIARESISVRYERAKEQLEKADAMLTKYTIWLRPGHKDAEPVEITVDGETREQSKDEAINAAVQDAIQAKAAELIEAEEASKAIADNATPVAA